MRKATISVPEFAKLAGISRSLTYTLVQNGEIPSLRLGSRWLIPIVEAEKLLFTKVKGV